MKRTATYTFSDEDFAQPLIARFEQIVQIYPHKVAVKADAEISYADLNRKSNQVAHAILTALGEGVEPVVLLLEHQIAMVSAILGTLKAGKIFSALDPTFPKSRLEFIRKDSECKIIVTDHQNLAMATAIGGSDTHIINVNAVEAFSDENLGIYPSIDTPAAIFYTSGSTGNPKGILYSYISLLHRPLWFIRAFDITSKDRISMLFFSSYAMSVYHLFGALLQGAALCMLFPGQVDLEKLSKWCFDEQVSILHPPAAIFQIMMKEKPDSTRFEQVRKVIVGGGAIFRQDVAKFYQFFSETCQLVHICGSTEGGPLANNFLEKNAQFTGNVVPVGRPIQDISLFDVNGKDVSPGEEGELVVRSPYIALGYWRRPELTQASFRPDLEKLGQRCFFTNDLAKLNPDGIMELVGRKDFMVKVRGIRVELNEIESALQQNRAIKKSFVMVVQDQDGNNQIVAYVEPRTLLNFDVHQVRAQIEQKLPAPMVPEIFILVDEFPLTSTGKIDRQALPAPTRDRPELNTQYVAPRTSIEDEIGKIWKTMLSLQKIGIHDHFFDLGGNSLKAIQIVTQIVNKFKVNVPVAVLFETATVAGIAEHVSANREQSLSEVELAEMISEIEDLSDEEVLQQLNLLPDNG
jgi:amino acid adenylation domain-containing protein